MDHGIGAQGHFERVATVYDRYRNTDPAVIDEIIGRLPQNGARLEVADVGCGTGRYSDILAGRLNGDLHLWCCDYSGAMLALCRERMRVDHPNGTVRFCRVSAMHLPFADQSVDAVVTFNAVHHFDLERFVAEAGRVLRPGGILGIYTRTPEQNARTVWGLYFPRFTDFETRLHPRPRLEEAVDSSSRLGLEDVVELAFVRTESAASLVDRARNYHYSTFSLYPPDEFLRAVSTFEHRLTTEVNGHGTVEHTAENTLLLARRRG